MSDQRFTTIFRTHYAALCSWIAPLAGDRETARDIAADVMLAFWQHNGDISEESVTAWLTTAAYRRCIDRQRREARVRRFAADYRHTTPLGSTDDRIVEREDCLVHEMLASLTPQTAEVFRLCYMERHRRREAAALLAVSESTVKKHLVRGLRALRERYRDQLTIATHESNPARSNW